ncbi:MAG: HNH endonuclease [Bryobacteraceae bacterium]
MGYVGSGASKATNGSPIEDCLKSTTLMAATITCIYCKTTRPPSREHVLQRSLGGDLVARFVCGPCNNGFSAMDQALAERSIVALTRVSETPATAFGSRLGWLATRYDPDRDILVELEIRNGFEVAPYSQLHVSRDGRGSLIAADADALRELAEFIDEQVRSTESNSIRPTVKRFFGLPGGEQLTAAVMVLRSPKDGFVRLPSPNDEQWLAEWLEHVWPEFRSKMSQRTDAPRPGSLEEVHLRMTYAPNDVYRAIAKSAFNVLASKCGTEVALRNEMDPIRDYIRGDVQLPNVSNQEALAVDQRFVRELLPDEKPFTVSDGHAVLFVYDSPSLVALVQLYGSHMFVVRFPDIVAVELPEIFGHEFSHDRTGNVDLPFDELARRILQRHPELIGMSQARAEELLKSI